MGISSHFPPIFFNHVPPQPSTTHMRCAVPAISPFPPISPHFPHFSIFPGSKILVMWRLARMPGVCIRRVPEGVRCAEEGEGEFGGADFVGNSRL